MLTDTEFAKTAREAAVRRAQAITEPNALTQQKLELIDAMLEQEKTMVDAQAVQTRTKAIETVDPMVWRALGTIAGGEVVQSEDFR